MLRPYPKKLVVSFRNVLGQLAAAFKRYWHKNWFHKTVVIVVCVVTVSVGTMYGIAQWYIASERSKPLIIGTTFISSYAESLGLSPQQTFDAIINDLGVKHLRLVSYWDELEPTKGNYNFSDLDWQFQKAEAAHVKISLSIGLRQPRWPECHTPTWAANEPDNQWQPQLNAFIAAVINRYKHSPSLDSYQLENEYFLNAFGLCTNFSRQRLITEYQVAKQADDRHPIIMSQSGGVTAAASGQPVPDEYGLSVYHRIWSPLLHGYFEYPFPAWYYGFLAGVQKLINGHDTIIHELQTEAWTPNMAAITQTSLAEQNKSFDAKRFQNRVEFGEATGMRTIYLWGSEYWYYRLTVLHDPSVWHVAQKVFRQANSQ